MTIPLDLIIGLPTVTVTSMLLVRSAELYLLTVNCTPGCLENMAVTPAIVLAKLQGLNISAEVIDHPAVLTVEVARKL